jgi:Rod binding domain-containing protein
MNIPALKPHINAQDIAPERLAKNPELTDREKINEASRQFEAILLKQVLESSQKTVIHSKISDDNSTASGIYHDMVTTQLADSISKSGSFGLAKTFEQQLNRPPAANPRPLDGKSATAPTELHPLHAAHTEVKKPILAENHSTAHPLKPLHERTLTKSH